MRMIVNPIILLSWCSYALSLMYTSLAVILRIVFAIICDSVLLLTNLSADKVRTLTYLRLHVRRSVWSVFVPSEFIFDPLHICQIVADAQKSVFKWPGYTRVWITLCIVPYYCWSVQWTVVLANFTLCSMAHCHACHANGCYANIAELSVRIILSHI